MAAENEIWVSVASLWEIVIKSKLGKLKLGEPFEEIIPRQLSINSMEVLGIRLDHLYSLSQLELYHRDPFDRMLIAQSLAEQLPIIGRDGVFDDYGVERLW